MVSILIGAALAVVIIRFAGIETRRSRSSHGDLIQPRPGLPALGVQIICGDCSGDEMAPIKTYMDRYGACETCGGSSYMLASRRGSGIDHRRTSTFSCGPAVSRSPGHEPAKSGVLLAFRTTAGYR